MCKLVAIFFAFAMISVLFAEEESLKIQGQFNVVDDSEETSSGAIAEEYDDKIFDELPSLRIAREYLRQKIAAERQQKSSEGLV